VLIVEDENDVNRLLATILSEYETKSAFSGTEAAMWLAQKRFDLVLLDLMLPGMTGEEVIADMRRQGIKTPVIVISAKQDVADRVNVLRLGADDFIMKPFEIDEVIARVEAVLRRCVLKEAQDDKKSGESRVLTFKNLTLNHDTRQVVVNDTEVTLTVKEFDILELLLRYPKKVFTRENLFTAIWGEDYFGEDNTVNVHISNLRQKLSKADKNTEYIKTVWGIGFKMAV
ncbi:MAG: response regulator transcription factor, partial [Catenibacillus sp.]|nr:response regulator transcription factor [Catenibacillus sp.]